MQSLKISSIIQVYRNQTPYQPNKAYKSKIKALARQIKSIQAQTAQPGKSDKVSYVYVYLDTRKAYPCKFVSPSGKVLGFDYRPIYVGKGKGRRWYDHIKQAKNLSNQDRKSNTIRKIKSVTGRYPKVVRIVEDVNDWIAQAIEIDTIAGVGRLQHGGCLLNLTDGGDGACGQIYTEAQNKANSERQIGKTISKTARKKHKKAMERAETRAKLRAARLGKPRSQESIEKQRETMLGSTQSPRHRARRAKAMLGNNNNGRPMSIDGTAYDSMAEAVKRLGYSHTTIRKRIRSDVYPDYFYIAKERL